MKRTIALFLVLLLFVTNSTAEEWICPSCGKNNTTNFCTGCGTKYDVWICPECKTENTDAFCGYCGTAKPVDTTPLVGTWKFNSFGMEIFLVLYSDSTCLFSASKGSIQSGTYSIRGDQLTISGNDMILFSSKFNIKADYLEIEQLGVGVKTNESIKFSLVMSGQSMEDTIQKGDTLMFERKQKSDFHIFDIAAVNYPGRGDAIFITRIVGMPGDTVSFHDGWLFVNNIKQNEQYISDNYRKGLRSDMKDFRIPKKGDILMLKNNGGYLNLVVEDDPWPWGRGFISGISADNMELTFSQGSIFVDKQELTFEDNGIKLGGVPIEIEELYEIVGKEFVIDKDYYFICGDNRNNSNDSRNIGPIDEDMILGIK